MSLLIRNVRIVDGRGREPYKADLLVQKDKISAIGNLRSKQAAGSIDGLGNFLVPGFIDPSAVPDRYLDLLTNPEQAQLKSGGVTTVIGGSGGVSLAPLVYGRLEALNKWSGGISVNTNWHLFFEMLESLSRLRLGVNFGSLAGYETIRSAIAGEEPRELTKNEQRVALKVIERALRDGAFGVSLGSANARMPKAEAKGIISQVNRHRGVISVSLDAKEGEEDVLKAIRSFSEKGREKVLVTDFFPTIGYEDVFEKVLASAPKNVRFALKPFPTALKTPYDILPEWVWDGRDADEVAKSLSEPEVAERAADELAWIRPEEAILAFSGRHSYLEGKSVSELGELYELPPAKALIKVFSICKLRCGILYSAANPEILRKHLTDESVFISTYGHSKLGALTAGRGEENHFSEYLRAATESGQTLPDAVKRITSAPAKFFNLENRGTILEGNFADLVLIDKDNFRAIETIVGGVAAGHVLYHRG